MNLVNDYSFVDGFAVFKEFLNDIIREDIDD